VSGRPLVGITTYPREGSEREIFSLPTAYVDAMRRAGAIPVLLTPGEDAAGELLDALDAICFAGGGDLDPERLGAPAHPANYGINTERDAFELALMGGALERGMPLLAICRGMQVLNVTLGGSLHAHLPEVVGDAVTHRLVERIEPGVVRLLPAHHEVRLAPSSGLAGIYEKTELHVASWHHQAVDRLGNGLRPVAWAPDDSIEALELGGEPQVLAVQWHPELQIEPGSPQLRLFRALVERTAERR
jgi:putative glutamine amidotransferase